MPRHLVKQVEGVVEEWARAGMFYRQTSGNSNKEVIIHEIYFIYIIGDKIVHDFIHNYGGVLY